MKKYIDFYSSCSDSQKKVLRYIAFTLITPDDNILKDIAFKGGINVTGLRDFLKLLKSENLLLEEKSFWEKSYYLTPSFQNFLLQEAALVTAEEIEEMYNFFSYSAGKFNDALLNQNRRTILNYLRNGVPAKLYSQVSRQISYFTTRDYLKELVLDWMEHPRLKVLVYMIEENLAKTIFEELYYRSLYTLDKKEIEVVNNFYETYDFKQYEREIKEKINFYTFLKGDISEYHRTLNTNSSEQKYYYAFLKLSLKKTAEALKLFNSALKAEGVLYPKNPFWGFVYAWTLKLNGKENNMKKLHKFEDVTIHDLHDNKLITLIGKNINCREDKGFREYINNCDFSHKDSVMMKYLTFLMLEYLKVKEFNDEELAFLYRFKKSEYHTMIYLGKGIFGFYDDIDPINYPGFESFIPEYKFTPEWERVLNNLIKTKEKNNDKITEEERETRIIYIIDKEGYITPKLQKRLKSNGNWSKGRDMSILNFHLKTPDMDDLDKEIADCVDQVLTYSWRNDIQYIINARKVLPLLAGKDRLFYDCDPPVPVDIIEEKPYISVSKVRNKYFISTNYIQEKESKELTSVYFNGNTQIKLVTISQKQREIITSLLRINEFPVEAKDKLTKLIGMISKDITVHSDLLASDTNVIQQSPDPTLIVQLLPKGKSFRAEFFVKPLGTALPYCKPGVGIRSVVGEIEGKSVQTTRDYIKENENVHLGEQIFEVCELTDDKNHIYTIDSAFDCLEILETAKDQDFMRIEWPEGVKLKLKGKASLSDFSCSLKSKTNWFEISGDLKVGDHLNVSLEDLLEQFRTNPSRRFIELNEGEYLSITDELRKAVNTFDSITVKDKGGLKISQFIAPSLQVFEKDGITIDGDSHFDSLVTRIDEASTKEYIVPDKLKATLREYQEDGFRWMAKLSQWGSGACLADDMGLGKTLQTIAMLLYRAEKGASLVVAPASVILNWQSEINRFAPALNCLVLNNGQDRDTIIKNSEAYDIVLTTYGLLITQEELCNKEWNMVVLDEAHTIKNRDTKMSKSAMKLKGDFRLLLTGTPVQNHLSEIWNLFQFMNPGLLGSYEHFFNNFILPVENEKNTERRKQLKNMIAPFLLRRTKNEVLQDLPGKTEIVISVEQTKEENLFYEKLRYDAEQRLNNKEMTAIQTLAEITRLRQAASNMRLVDDSVSKTSSKLEAFFKLYEDITDNDHRALVFSQFTSHLALLKEELDRRNIPYLYLDGSTPVNERLKLVKKFQTGDQPLFLISLKAGGLGLNLTAADFVVHLDPWWNPAIEDQASDRAYRIGQQRPVTIYRLITKNTIEEKILDLHHTKKNIADSLLEGTNMSNKLTRDDLLLLLRSF